MLCLNLANVSIGDWQEKNYAFLDMFFWFVYAFFSLFSLQLLLLLLWLLLLL